MLSGCPAGYICFNLLFSAIVYGSDPYGGSALPDDGLGVSTTTLPDDGIGDSTTTLPDDGLGDSATTPVPAVVTTPPLPLGMEQRPWPLPNHRPVLSEGRQQCVSSHFLGHNPVGRP